MTGPSGAATRQRERVAESVGKAVEKAVHQASETWPQHREERGWVGDLVGALQRNLDAALAGTDVRAVVESKTIPEEIAGGADLEIRVVTPDGPDTKRIVLQAKREDKLKEGAPSQILRERRRLAKQIVDMRRDAPKASGVLILRPQGPTVCRDPERKNISIRRLLDEAEPLSKTVRDLVACDWGQVVPSQDLAVLEVLSREYIARGAAATERIVITLITPRDLLSFDSYLLEQLTLNWRQTRPS